MTTKREHYTAAQLERQKAKTARRERNDRIWTIIMVVIALLFIVTILAIQASHHL
jgi:uncharacterized integral membrane protein